MIEFLKTPMSLVAPQATVETWLDWAILSDSIHPTVYAFVVLRPALFDSVAPISWQRVSEILKYADKALLRDEMIKKILGDEIGGEFVAFAERNKNLRKENV